MKKLVVFLQPTSTVWHPLEEREHELRERSYTAGFQPWRDFPRICFMLVNLLISRLKHSSYCCRNSWISETQAATSTASVCTVDPSLNLWKLWKNSDLGIFLSYLIGWLFLVDWLLNKVCLSPTKTIGYWIASKLRAKITTYLHFYLFILLYYGIQHNFSLYILHIF